MAPVAVAQAAAGSPAECLFWLSASNSALTTFSSLDGAFFQCVLIKFAGRAERLDPEPWSRIVTNLTSAQMDPWLTTVIPRRRTLCYE